MRELEIRKLEKSWKRAGNKRGARKRVVDYRPAIRL